MSGRARRDATPLAGGVNVTKRTLWSNKWEILVEQHRPAHQVLKYYQLRFEVRFGRPPKGRKDDQVWANTLRSFAGDDEKACALLETWFASDDLWPRAKDYRCLHDFFSAINRLIAIRRVTPPGTPEQQELQRQFAAVGLEPLLRRVK
jgi:hypothetical protein